MQSDLYQDLGKELRQLLKELSQNAPQLPLSSTSSQAECLTHIVALARQIGDPFQKEAKGLQEAFDRWRVNPADFFLLAQVQSKALYLEQETREI